MENYVFDCKHVISGQLLAGVDEAGRGPLAGPVVAAAVILDLNAPIEGLNDSKALSEKMRIKLCEIIKNRCMGYGVCFIPHNVIDEINIYQAARLAMKEALKKLPIKPDVILTDAMALDFENAAVTPYIKGDTLSASIMAASIIAKVERDNYMLEMEKKYSGYGFAVHKGYPTKAHREAIRLLGPCEIHRKSFKLLPDNG